MKLKYIYHGESIQLKKFIFQNGISRNLLAKIKFQGGKLLVNGSEKTVRYQLNEGDEVVVVLPKEEENDLVRPDDQPIDILYEDEFLLIVNKPPYLPSVPTSAYLDCTMVNRVKAHLLKQNSSELKIHTVTRLDKDTSGAMIFAKNGYVHSLLDRKLQNKDIKKYYSLIVDDYNQKILEYGRITEKIARKEGSIIERKVDPCGKIADTEYWLLNRGDRYAYLKVQLHTGRTHQIRVHFSHLGTPLVGDTLYNSMVSKRLLPRQALHCHKLVFDHPITEEILEIEAPLPDEMKKIIDAYCGG